MYTEKINCCLCCDKWDGQRKTMFQGKEAACASSRDTGKCMKALCQQLGQRQKTKNRKPCRSESSGTILCMAEENSIFEIAEVTHPEADSLQDFSFVVAAFNKSI